MADLFTNVLASNQDQSSAIQPVINVQITLNTAGNNSTELLDQFPKVKVEEARKSDVEPNLSMKSDFDDGDSVQTEVVKKEDDEEGDVTDTKDFKDPIKKTVKLDGQWKHVDVKLIPQTPMYDDIEILNTDIPIQTNQDDFCQYYDIKPTSVSARQPKQSIGVSRSANVLGVSKSIFGERSFS